jgi:hypothetical protein
VPDAPGLPSWFAQSNAEMADVPPLEIAIGDSPDGVKPRKQGWLRRELLAQAAGLAVQALQPFILTPLFVHAWGDATYGRWLALTAIASHFALTDLGAQMYFQNAMASAHSRRDTAEFRGLLSQGWSALVLTGSQACELAVGRRSWWRRRRRQWLPSLFRREC